MDVLREKMDIILSHYDYQVEDLLPILLEVQHESDGRYISESSAMYIADQVKIPYAQISEVMTFFSALNSTKKGKYHIEMCNGTVCRVNEKSVIESYLEDTLHIKVGETTADGLFTLDHAPCFGACDISPSVRINKKAYGHLTIEKMKSILEKLRGDSDDL